MMRLSMKAVCAAALVASVGSATAQRSAIEVEHTQTVYTEEAAAKSWRLSAEEWARYKELMKGPRGVWSPSLDPITVLGIAAETDAERKHFADLLVMVEFDRAEKELRFQQAYDEAAKRLFPDLPRVTVAASAAAIAPVPGADRIAFVGSVDPNRCPSCQQALSELMRLHAAGRGPGLDLYLSDAEDDDAIRAWARRYGVSPDEVRSGRITLNHAGGTSDPSVVGSAGVLRLLQRVAGQWLPLGGPQ